MRLSQTAVDDVAAKLGLDSYDVFMKNLVNVTNERGQVYAEEMKIAAKLMDWKAKWHPHGKGDDKGSIVSGLGMAIHTWGGGGHASSCLVKIHPDGGVETFLGSQDLGTGTRTVIAMVLAETFGLPLSTPSRSTSAARSIRPAGPRAAAPRWAASRNRPATPGSTRWSSSRSWSPTKLQVSADALVAKDGTHLR